MPQFVVEVPSGERITVEANSERDAVFGAQRYYEDWQSKKPATPSEGLVPAVKSGISSALGGYGSTLEQLGGEKDNFLSKAAESTSPGEAYQSNFEKFKKSWAPRHALGAAIEGLPGFGADAIAAAGTGSLVGAAGGGPVGAAVGAGVGFAGSYALRNFGNTAKEMATYRTGDPNAQPDNWDRAKALGLTIGEGALMAVPGSRFLGPLAKGAFKEVGTQGVAKSIETLLGKSLGLGAASAGTDLTHQVVTKAGTDVPVDLNQTAASGALGSTTGAVFGTRRAAKDAAQAIRFREISPELQLPATQVANALAAKAEQGGALGKRGRTDAKALDDVRQDIKSDISGIYSQNKALKGSIELDPDARAAFQRAKEGGASDADVRTIAEAARGANNAEPLVNALHRLRAADVLESRVTRAGNRAVGGISGALESSGMRAFNNPAAVGGAALVGATPLNPIAYAPSTVAALGGVYGGARLLDKALGMRSPVKAFAEKFAEPSTGVRGAIAPPEQAPEPTPPYMPPSDTTGPKLPLIQPWASRPLTPSLKEQQAQMDLQVRALLSAEAARRKRATTSTELTPPASEDITPANVKQATDYMRGVSAMRRLHEMLNEPTEAPSARESASPQGAALPSLEAAQPPTSPVAPSPPAASPAAPTVAPVPPQPAGLEVPPGASVSQFGGQQIVRMPSAIPPTPLETVKKITKSKGKTKVKTEAITPQLVPVEAPKPPIPPPFAAAPRPAVSDDLAIPDFLRRDAENRLPGPSGEQTPKASEGLPNSRSSERSGPKVSEGLSLDDIVKERVAKREANGGFTHGKENYERGVRVKLEKRELIARRLASVTELPYAELRAKALDTRVGQVDLFKAWVAQKLNYDKAKMAKVEKAFRGQSKAW